ncbi:hypothetical protein Tco_0178450 [Tanacetum coccineum]
MNRRKKHFAKLRAEEIRRKPPTKAQKRNQICFVKEMNKSKYFVRHENSGRSVEVVEDKTEELKAEKDDDPEEEEMKKHMEIVQDEDEIAIDAIPLATKPPMIVEYMIGIDREDLETIWKLVKEKQGIKQDRFTTAGRINAVRDEIKDISEKR